MTSGQQYFVPHPESRSHPRRLSLDWKGRAFSFSTDTGVFSKNGLDAGSRALLASLPERLSGRVLDLGCGWGAMGILAAAFHPEADVLMTDINERAAALAEQNASVNGIKAKVLVSDGFDAIEDSFDWILINPPIRSGKETVYRLFSQSASHLRPGGTLLVVIRSKQGAPSALRFLAGLFDTVRVVERSGGYWVIACSGGSEHDV